MSWDVLIQDLPDVATIEDIPDDFRPKPLGSRAEVVDWLKASFPEADFSDPNWGILDGLGWSIEFNVGDADPCDSVMLHVRGGGEEALAAVQRTIDAVGGRGLDMQAEGSGFFELDEARTSFAKWQNYRDRMVAEDNKRSTGFFGRLFGLK